MGVDATGRDQESVGVDHHGSRADDDVDIGGDIGVAGLADAGDTPLPDADARHADPVDGIEDDGVGEQRIAGLLGRYRPQSDAVPARLGESDSELVMGVADPVGDSQAQPRSAQSQHIARARAVAAHVDLRSRSARAAACSASAVSLTGVPSTTSR